MSLRVSLTYFVIVLCCLATGIPVQSQLYERYLKGYHGPYRGRVIDADTKKPLAGAVVVVVWKREIPMIIQTNTDFYEAREVLTDERGEFILQAEDIEAHAPARTLRPNFVIFLPGYGWFPRFGRVLRDLVGGNFEGPGSDVELPRLKSPKERREALRGLPPILVPDEKMPNLLKLMNVEAVNLGLKPIHEPGVR